MNVILDECLPRRLLRDLHDHSVTTVPRQGWASTDNGELLRLVSIDFDVFITLDKSIEHQQNLSRLEVCLIVLHVPNSRYETIEPLVPDIRDGLSRATPGEIIRISS